MIEKWSKQEIIKELEYVKDGENIIYQIIEMISNHELTEPINLIGLIDSKKRNNKSQSLSSATRAKMFIY